MTGTTRLAIASAVARAPGTRLNCTSRKFMTPSHNSKSKPTGAPARAKVLLVGSERRRGLVKGPRRLGAGEEVDVDPTDAPGAKLDVAETRPRIWFRLPTAPKGGGERRGHRTRRALGEDAGLRR